MKRIYLVAREQIVSGRVYDAGAIFLVAANDAAEGGWHARFIQQSDIMDEKEFDMDYENGPCPKDDPNDFLFVPYFLAEEFTDAEKAVEYSNSLNEEAGYIA